MGFGARRVEVSSSWWPVRTADFEIDLVDRCVRFPDGEEVRFTPRQWQLLEVLVRSAGRPHTTVELAGTLFGDDAPEEAHQIPVLASQLRRKLEPDLCIPRYVRSPDAGTYRFDSNGGAQPGDADRHSQLSQDTTTGRGQPGAGAGPSSKHKR